MSRQFSTQNIIIAVLCFVTLHHLIFSHQNGPAPDHRHVVDQQQSYESHSSQSSAAQDYGKTQAQTAIESSSVSAQCQRWIQNPDNLQTFQSQYCQSNTQNTADDNDDQRDPLEGNSRSSSIVQDGSKTYAQTMLESPTLSEECRKWLENPDNHTTFQSQYGQDWWFYQNIFSRYKEPGFYVDVGAYDGLWISNSYFFDKCLGWKGICIEANPSQQDSLRKHRGCHVENVCASDKEATLYYNDPGSLGHVVTDANQGVAVPCVKLQDLLDKYNVKTIDFMTMDIESHEVTALNSIDLSKTLIKHLVVEQVWNSKRLNFRLRDMGMLNVGDVGPDDAYVHYSAFSEIQFPVKDFSNFKEIREQEFNTMVTTEERDRICHFSGVRF